MLELAFERDLPFAPVIVWDALVDPVLVDGWMPVPFDRITDAVPHERLQVDSAVGRLRFHLVESAGGPRGTSTRLTLHAEARHRHFDWPEALDDLHDLLHGHPVDWAAR